MKNFDYFLHCKKYSKFFANYKTLTLNFYHIFSIRSFMTFSSIVIFLYLWLSRAWTTPIAKANKLSSASLLGQTFIKIREINVSFGSFVIGENNLEYAVFVLVDCFQLWVSSGIA